MVLAPACPLPARVGSAGPLLDVAPDRLAGRCAGLASALRSLFDTHLSFAESAAMSTRIDNSSISAIL